MHHSLHVFPVEFVDSLGLEDRVEIQRRSGRAINGNHVAVGNLNATHPSIRLGVCSDFRRPEFVEGGQALTV